MCTAADDWAATDGGGGYPEEMLMPEVPRVSVIPTAYAGVDWAEVHDALRALDPSLIIAPVPGEFAELWRLHGTEPLR
ncbi:MAG TPA: hypothetical protein VF210_18165 [Pseudomonadales bacterium]